MNLQINSDADMKDFGATLGQHLVGGEVIELVGDVGAGKTTLTKGIARGLGVDEDVQSPSFTISRIYDAAGGLRLAHYDFYRLHDPGIMTGELHESMTDPQTVTVIEWAEIVSGVLPADRLTITLALTEGESVRELKIRAAGEQNERLLKEIA